MSGLPGPAVDDSVTVCAPPRHAKELVDTSAPAGEADLLRAEIQRTRDAFDDLRRSVSEEEDRFADELRHHILGQLVDIVDEVVMARRTSLDDDFRYVTDLLTGELEGMGLERFGRQGDPYDETLHDAVQEVTGDALVAHPTCKVVRRPGYRVGDHVLRPAQVVVALPSHPASLFLPPTRP